MKNNFKWTYPQNILDDRLFSEIKKIAGSEIIAKLLINRGITSVEEADNFLNLANAEISSPFVFPDMEKAVERINRAIENQEHIVVFGDFDADGITSTALLYKTLKLLGANASFYLPDRQEEGHGLNSACVCKLISSRKAKLLITVDCGISNAGEIKLASSLGTDTIITDHHEPQEEIPAAFAIINPKMLEDKEIAKNIKYLAGVGVAYKLAAALLESNNKEHLHDEIFYFVPLGTVGDVVPLLGENRTFVHRGINLISEKRPACIGKILETCGYKPKHKISTSVIAFSIVPKINAVGRLSDASPIVDFLMSDNEEALNAFANELDFNNKKRQQMCEETFLEAETMMIEELNLEKDKAIILAKKDWHPGIIGIVASKLVEKYYRPVLLVSISEEKNQARGSARSVDSLNLFETISEFAELFIQFGGHASAAGFSFDLSTISFEKFREKLNLSINKTLVTDEMVPELIVDVEIQPEDLTESFIKEVGRLEPFGEANPSPVFSMSGLTLTEIKKIGNKKNHLKFFLTDDNGLRFEAVWWQKDSLNVEENEKVNVAFSPSINSYMDKTAIQLIVKDLKPAFESKKSEPEKLEQEKWFDLRNITGLKKDFINFIKSVKNNISIFAETQRSFNILEQDETLKSLSVGRTDINKSDYLVIMDLPPDKKTFLNILNKTQAKEIHFIGLNPEIDPVETVKKFSGMLKYAFNNKDGVVNIEQIASLLSISSDSVLACAELLNSAGVVEIDEITENIIKFSFIENAELNLILELPEYPVFINSLEESEQFRKKLSQSEIERLRKEFSQNYLEAVL